MLNDSPLSTQTLASSQPLIRQNFSVVNTAFELNHVTYNDGSGNQGKHKFVQFPVQSAIPAGIAASDISLYNKLPAAPYPTTGVNELFLVKPDGTTHIPITASLQAQTGWSYLPSGVLMKWGRTTSINASEPFAYLYPTAASIPVFANVFTVMLTVIDNNTPYDTVVTIQTGTISATGFSIIYNGTPPGATVVNYLAIGN